jgi:prolyl-tRNA synthetase
MRLSNTLIPTLRDAPQDAEIDSHKLMMRAGLIRKLSAGLYTFMPLGLKALRNVERIIREEMNRAGAIEVLMPSLQPKEIWETTGRYETLKKSMFRIRDRQDREMVLGPTHEEVITELVSHELNSYRHLPRTFYQIQTKFRDEIRPRFGLMRAKEFLMKDAYSFDATDAGAMASYHKMYDAYNRIFARCGLQAFPVEADTGVIGGNYSHEFMVPAETGENDVVYCESGKYAANIEKAISRGPVEGTPTESSGAAPEKFATPGVVTIEALAAAPFGVSARHQIKTLVFVADSKPILVLIRGDDSLNEAKLMAKTGAVQVRQATAEEIVELLGARPGSLGAVSATLKTPAVPVYADEALRGARGMTTGANEDGFHLRHVEVDRDVKVSAWYDLRTVKVGESCVETQQPLKIRRAIEVGHVFKLGTKYSEKLNATFLSEDGSRHPAVMGCYGIGVTRTLQAVIEQCNDKDGIRWPVSVAPFTVCITPLTVAPESQPMTLARELAATLEAAGIEAILDDRDERPGVKFKDSELVGFPLRVNLGEKSLAKGEVELKPRGGTMRMVPIADAAAEVIAWVRAESARLQG